MRKHCIARMDGRRQRFFAGRYRDSGTFPVPVTTGRHDKALEYDDTRVAQLVCNFFNLVEGVRTDTVLSPWMVIDLPEARK